MRFIEMDVVRSMLIAIGIAFEIGNNSTTDKN